MRHMRLTGAGAGAEKYDLLTALAVAGLASGTSLQVSMLRLIALVTARYNWILDEVSIGQREMAALWSVDERTAKRETRRLTEGGFLEVKRRGVRGRVATYRLCIERIYALAPETWSRVGPDFHGRMAGRVLPSSAAPNKVTQLPADPWGAVLHRLREGNEPRFAAWFARMRLVRDTGDSLVIEVPSSFVQSYIATHLMTDLQRAVDGSFVPARRCLLMVAN